MKKAKKTTPTATQAAQIQKTPSMTRITLRVESDLKHDADALFEALGLDTSTAINLFLRQALRKGGLPFKVKLDKAQRKALLARTSDSARAKAKAHVDGDDEDDDDKD